MAAAPNLTDISIKGRQAVRYGIYTLILYFIARLAISASLNVYHSIAPEATPPPSVGFNRIATIPFPDESYVPDKVNYKVETATGALPVFPDQMKVYLMPKFPSTLASVDTARQKATALKFTIGPVALKPVVYRFSNPKTPASMTINIVTGVFSTSYNLAADPIPLESTIFGPDAATKEAKSLLSQADSLPEDLTGPVKHDYLKVEGQNLVTAISQAEASLIRVNFYRKNIEQVEATDETEGFEGYPSLPPNPKQGNTWLILSGSRDENRILIGSEFKYYPIDETKFETYPIKTAQQAIEDLQNNKAYIANFGLNPEGNITIRRIYLAYYDPDVESQFYQPIIVLEGDNDFYAYVPAVTNDYYGQEEGATQEASASAETSE